MRDTEPVNRTHCGCTYTASWRRVGHCAEHGQRAKAAQEHNIIAAQWQVHMYHHEDHRYHEDCTACVDGLAAVKQAEAAYEAVAS